MDVTVLIPVLGRPTRVRPLLRSLVASETDLRLLPVFLCSPNDLDEQRAVRDAGITPRVVDWLPGAGDYAKKMNLGFREAVTDWIFLAADDLRFNRGWADEAIRVAVANDVCVVGTNDLGNERTVAGYHSTHTLVHRDYGGCGTVDAADRILHEGYDHNYVDDEFVQTAIWRDTYAHAPRSIVEHLHPDWGKGTIDETYVKGKARFYEDRELYRSRKRLWGKR